MTLYQFFLIYVAVKSLNQLNNNFRFDGSLSRGNFNQAKFVLNYYNKDQTKVLNLKHGNVNVSMESFVNNISNLLDEHIPLGKYSKFKLKIKKKLQTTVALEKSISFEKA